ncbi:MAG TPA: DNA methyltransferase [Flavobacterium sp.]|nr:DNA methyltransferase [Flavobacterium sp.]
MKRKFYKESSIANILFETEVELLPSVTELFELELAYLERKVIPKKDFLERTGFFKSLNGEPSKHYLLYSEQPEVIAADRSSATQNYFENGQFSTGYATHSLFPYRGKFHPQLIKGILNIIGVKKGDTVLDPMCGSGTTNIEAALLGLDSVACDISPFCRLMTEVKYESLKIKKRDLENFKLDPAELFKLFNNSKKTELRNNYSPDEFRLINLARLAFLDAMGYANRVVNSTHLQLYKKVLYRYFETVRSLISNPNFDAKALGKVSIHHQAEALDLKIHPRSIDAIITSPPYSFAIDYVANDKDQLEYLGHDINNLKEKMIGLKGKSKDEKLKNYFDDMEIYCSEISKVLKKGKIFVLIIGSNTNQTGGIRLENKVIESAQKFQLNLVKTIIKPIKGIRNTMKDEHILFFEKT